LRVLETQHVDLVISDEVMPHINGLRLLETIKSRWPGTRRILYSGHMDTDVIVQAVNRGGVHKVLSKGISMEAFRAELAELIEACLDQRIEIGPDAEPNRSRSSGPPEQPTSVLLIADRLAVQGVLDSSLRADGFEVRKTTSSE